MGITTEINAPSTCRDTIAPWLHHNTPHRSALDGADRGSGSNGHASRRLAPHGQSSTSPPTAWACSDVTIDTAPRQPGKSFDGGSYKTADRYESDLVAVDPLTGEIRKKIHMRYPNYSGALTTAGGVVVTALLDGTVAAYDDTTLAELWKINIGSGVSAPPMTFESGGKQFIAIVSGPSNTAKAKLVNTPELKDQRNATILYVFGL